MQQAANELIDETDGVDVQHLSRQFGLSEGQAQSAVASLLPMVMGGMQRANSAPGGLDQLAGMAGGFGHTSMAAPQGNAILGQIFGSKDVSRQVTSHASQQTGIPDAILKAMLPVVAAMAAQAVARRMGGGMLGQLAGAAAGGMAGNAMGGGMPSGLGSAGGMSGGLGGLIGMLAGGGGGGGNPLDAILGGRR